MGIYEKIKEVLKDEENLKVSIRETDGTLQGDCVRITDVETGRSYQFTICYDDLFEAEHMARYAITKLKMEVFGRNEWTLKRIEKALNIRLEQWQRAFILSESLTYPRCGRRTGRTLAHKIKILLTAQKKQIVIYSDDVQYFNDEPTAKAYGKTFVKELQELAERLREAGIRETPEIILRLNQERMNKKREGRVRWN